MTELCDLVARHCHRPVTTTPIPRLILSRSDRPTDPAPAVYHPLLCVLVRGRKRVSLGDAEFTYDPGHYLVATADLPVTGQVVEAPALGCVLTLDPAALAGLLLDLPPAVEAEAAPVGMAINPLGDDLLDPLVRLLRLLDRPRDAPVLAPLIEREILYRLLGGPGGGMLRQLARPDSQLSRVSRAIRAIHDRYNQPLPADDLAHLAAMSPTSFHRHFRAVTGMSPLQFQKQVRLREARRRMLIGGADAATVGFDVGYESPSQFSREYRRLFGAPPARDAADRRRRLVPSGAR